MGSTGERKICLAAPSYVIYEHADLEAFAGFADDFHLDQAGSADARKILFFSGYGRDPYVYVARQAPTGQPKRFLGAGFLAASAEDFEQALKQDNAVVVDTKGFPGGGRCVQLRDPNGKLLEVVFDQEHRVTPRRGVSSLQGQPAVNGALEKRRRGEFTRMKAGPAKIHKLGHYGCNTDNLDATLAWYTNTFNFVSTDVLHAPAKPELDVAHFMRVDNSKTYVDHHCLLLARVEKGTNVHHSSFEVEDIDTQFMGHQWLEQKGHELVWALVDTFTARKYSTTVNEDTQTPRAEAGNMAVWGPPVPEIWNAKKQQHEIASRVAAVSG